MIILLFSSVGFGETGAVYGFDTKAVVRYDGYTEWFAPTEIHSICGIDITYFPFDEQRCLLKFGSWTYTGASLDFVNMRDAADVSQYIESGEWELKEASLVRNVVHYSCCPDPYVDITYTIHIKRKILYYLTNLILPCLLLSALTIFTHCLPPESGERMGLVITILLGLTVFMLLFTDAVPRTSEVIPLIGKYAFTVLCEVAVSLLFTSYVLMIYHKSPRKRMPGWFRNVIYNVLAPLLCKTTPNGKCFVTIRYVMSYYALICYVMSYHVLLCYVMLCYVMSCQVLLCYVMLCYVMSCHVKSCYVMLCYVKSCHVMSCHVMICNVMLCYILYYIMLYYIILCCVM